MLRPIHNLLIAAVPPFLEERMPAALLRHGPGGMAWWQWLALPLLVVIALAIGWVLGWVSRRLAGRVAARTSATWDDALVASVGPQVTLLWALLVAYLLMPLVALEGKADAFSDRVIRAGFFLAAFWGVYRAIDVAFNARADPGQPGGVARRAFFRKAAKLAVVALGVISVLTELGFQVTSLLAGLGIGGIAVALAAQKTVENLIGSVTIGMDRPFRLGDAVLVDGVVGTVEAVGLRSTRLRTPDRTLVTFPNGRLADMRIESYSARDRWRLVTTLGLRYGTASAQVREVVAGIEAALRDHPAASADAPLVWLAELKDSCLAIEVQGWVRAADYQAYGQIRGELYLRFLEIVEAAGTGLAFPTRTLHVESLPGPVAPRPPTP
jgi:MscS family membrane protein